MTIQGNPQQPHFPVIGSASVGIKQSPSPSPAADKPAASAPPRRQDAPSAGHAFVGVGEVPPAPTKSTPPPLRSGAEPAVSASTLVDGGVDHAVERTALVEQRIDGWLKNQHRTAEEICDALKGNNTELGKLPPTQQRYLISRAFDYMGVFGFRGLAERVRGNASVCGIVAEALFKRAVLLEGNSRGGGALDANDPHNYARALTSDALIAMTGDDAGLVGLLYQMPLLAGERLAQSLGDGDRQGADERLSNARNQILTVLNGAQHTPTTSAIVKGLFLQTSPADMAGTPGLADNMTIALAREYHPDNQAKASAEMPRLAALMNGEGAQLLFGGSIARKQIVYDAARDSAITARIFDRQTLNYYRGDAARIPVVAEAMARARISAADAGRVSVDTPAEENIKIRLAGILQTPGGQELFFSGKAPAQAIDLARQIIRTHPEITFETFGGMKGNGNPWLIPELARPIAEAYAAGSHDHRPVRVPGAFGVENLVVGPAMGMIPTLPRGDGWQDRFNTLNKAVADGTLTPKQIREESEALSDISLYDRPEQAIIHKIAAKIRHVASTDPARVDCEYVTLFTDCGPIQCPRFRVQSGVDAKGLPTYAYVDNTGADYADLGAWEKKNQLPDGIVYHYREPDENGKSELVGRPTPEASKSTAGKVADAAALGGCYAAGVAAIVVTGGAIVVVSGVAVASGLWMAFRSADNLYDRHTRGQSVASLDALGDWLGVAGGLAGAGAFAASLKRAAAVAALQKLASGINLAGFGYQGGMLVANWGNMTPGQRDAVIFQTIATGSLTVAHGAAPPAPRALPGQSPLKTLDAPPTPEPAQPTPAPARVPNPGDRSPGPIDHDGLPVVDLRQPLGQRLWGEFVPPDKGTSDTAPHPVEQTWGLRGTRPWTLPKELPAKHRPAGEAPPHAAAPASRPAGTGPQPERGAAPPNREGSSRGDDDPQLIDLGQPNEGEHEPPPRLASGTAQHEVGPTQTSWALPGPLPPAELPPGFVPPNAAGRGQPGVSPAAGTPVQPVPARGTVPNRATVPANPNPLQMAPGATPQGGGPASGWSQFADQPMWRVDWTHPEPSDDFMPQDFITQEEPAGHGQPGVSPTAGAPGQTGPSRPAAGNRPTPPVDPITQRMVGGDEPNGGGPDSSGQPPASSSPGEGPAGPATAPPVDPTVEIKRLEKRLDDAQRVYQRQLELQGAQRTRGTRAFDEAREAYERARVSLEIKRDPYPQSTPLDPFREVDAPMTALHTADQNYLRALEEGSNRDINESLGKRNAAYEKARDALSKAEKEHAIRIVTPESMTAVERAAAQTRTDYDAALQKVRDEQAKLPDGVSMETIEAYHKARDAYQKANDAAVKMESSPEYWECQAAELGKQAVIAENKLRIADVVRKIEQRHGGVSEPTQTRFDNAGAERDQAEAAVKNASDKAAEMREQFASKRKEYQDRLGRP